jgi:hypothetical protein
MFKNNKDKRNKMLNKRANVPEVLQPKQTSFFQKSQVKFRAVKSVHKSSESDSSIFKTSDSNFDSDSSTFKTPTQTPS